MPLIVTREGAAPESLSFEAAFAALAPNVDLSDLFPCLKRREAFAVTFRDGRRGTLSGVDGPIRLFDADGPVQASLALAPLPLPNAPRQFDLQARLMIAVEVKILCRAQNPGHAQVIADEVFRGLRRVEDGFAAVINTDEVAGQFHDIKQAIRDGDMSMLRHNRLVIDQVREIYPDPEKDPT